MVEKRALISVYDKTGIEEFAHGLVSMGWQIVSSSGTAQRLRDAGLEVIEVSELTGYPQMLGGRVKTLHPAIFGGILARRHLSNDLSDVEQFNIPLIDMVICNLYPFEETARKGSELDELLENIDIGGVTLIRAAAKNFNQVIICTDPRDYSVILEEIQSEGDLPLQTRERLALKAFCHTAEYDTTIYTGLKASTGLEENGLSETIPMNLHLHQSLRYGENPHQQAGLYLPPLSELPWEQVSGKPLSYNNILDLDCAMRGCSIMQDRCGCLVIKHTTPCGMAYGKTTKEAYEKAFRCDPLSAFGGIVGFTRKLDLETAKAISENFTEVLLVPEYDKEALVFLSEKKPSLRILRWKGGRILSYQVTGTWSGILIQNDDLPPLPVEEKGVWIGEPRSDLWEDLILAWKTAYVSKSNSVAIIKDGEAVGIGMGFCSRVFAVNFAVEQAGTKAQGAVMSSDAFFPFPDAVESAAAAGINAIIQPGGSRNDESVFARAKELGISMFISDWRTFRH